MKPRDRLVIVIVLLTVGGLYFLSTRGRVPQMPATPSEHLTAKTRDACLTCHVPDKMNELELARKHPLKWRDQRISCLQCHKPPVNQAQTANLQIESSNLSWLKQ